MRTGFLVTALLLLGAASPTQASWLKPGWTPPEAVHLVSGGFHKSDSSGKQVVRSPKEFKDPEWGSVAKQIFKHPVRPLAGHLKK